jgi:hypothetical protein
MYVIAVNSGTTTMEQRVGFLLYKRTRFVSVLHASIREGQRRELIFSGLGDVKSL